MSVQQELDELNQREGTGRRVRKNSAATATEETPENGIAWRNNPEIDAKIDQYIAANPGRQAFWESQTPRLIRQALLKELTGREQREERFAAVQAWMKESPGREQEVLASVRNVPEESSQAAIISVAEKMAANEGIQSASKPRQAAGMKV
jgi:hypothetical protein